GELSKKASQKSTKSANKRQEESTTTADDKKDNETVDEIIDQNLPDEIPRFVKAVRSNIENEKVTVEMVVDATKIPWEQLPGQYRRAQEYLSRLPSQSLDNLFIQISGKPIVEGDQLTFDENTTVRIGKLDYTLGGVVSSLGEDRINALRRQISVSNLPFKNIMLQDGALILRK
ncbi:MAG: hypothetical protein GWN16_13810, partial [Calditrichae bacterium]|nr:hypothetical protein [Calditrichia bacterium]